MTQSEFDSYRQKIWEQGQALVAQWGSATTPEQKRSIYDQMNSLLSGFKATYDSVRCPPGTNVFACGGRIAASWIDSRFHDFYDALAAFPPRWAQELSALPVAQGGGTVTSPLSPATDTSGCEAGICGPTAPSQPLALVPTGGPGAGGVPAVATTGGGITVAPPATLPPIQTGLAPSPGSSDLPGSLTPTALTPTGAVAAPVPLTTTMGGTFDIVTFLKGPMGKTLLLVGGIVGVLYVLVRRGARA